MEEGTLRSKGGNYFLPIDENMPWAYSARSMAKKMPSHSLLVF